MKSIVIRWEFFSKTKQFYLIKLRLQDDNLGKVAAFTNVDGFLLHGILLLLISLTNLNQNSKWSFRQYLSSILRTELMISVIGLLSTLKIRTRWSVTGDFVITGLLYPMHIYFQPISHINEVNLQPPPCLSFSLFRLLKKRRRWRSCRPTTDGFSIISCQRT